MRLVLAFAAFQAGWFSAVLGAANAVPWLGPCVVAALAVVFVARGSGRAQSMAYLAICGVLGFVLDSALTMAGMLRFPLDGHAGVSPLWMTALWLNFAMFVPVGLRWLYGKPGLAAAFGAAGGPAAYWAGQRLGALEWSTPHAVGAVAAEWAAATPAIFWLASRMERKGDLA